MPPSAVACPIVTGTRIPKGSGGSETNRRRAAPFSERAARPVARRNEGPYDRRHVPQPPRFEFSREYVERLVAADPDVERHFADYFRGMLVLKVAGRLRSRALVDDAVQETLTRVLAALKRGSVQNPAALGAFVNTVCNHVLLELYRSGSRTTPLEDDYDRADDRLPSAESTMVGADDRARVREALDALPQKERDLLYWLFFEDRDKDDVCRMLKIDRSYLRVLLHRAKARFREHLVEPAPSSGDRAR